MWSFGGFISKIILFDNVQWNGVRKRVVSSNAAQWAKSSWNALKLICEDKEGNNFAFGITLSVLIILLL